MVAINPYSALPSDCFFVDTAAMSRVGYAGGVHG